MFFTRFVIGCIFLSIWPYVVTCQSDASLEVRESKLSQPGTGFEPRRFVENGIDDVKPMLDNQDMAVTDYQNFGIDEHRLARDIDSVESNVNVNVNSLASSRLPWHKPRSKRRNRRPESTFGRNSKKKIHPIMRLIHQMPDSNFDYNFAHPDGHVRLQRRRNSRGKTLREMPNEDNEELVPKTGSTYNQCGPIVYEGVQYLRLMEKNLKSLENELRSVVSDPNYNFP